MILYNFNINIVMTEWNPLVRLIRRINPPFLHAPEEFSPALTEEGADLYASYLNILQQIFPPGEGDVKITQSDRRRPRGPATMIDQAVRQSQAWIERYDRHLTSLGQRRLNNTELRKLRNIFQTLTYITKSQTAFTYIPRFLQNAINQNRIVNTSRGRNSARNFQARLQRQIGDRVVQLITQFLVRQTHQSKVGVDVLSASPAIGSSMKSFFQRFYQGFGNFDTQLQESRFQIYTQYLGWRTSRLQRQFLFSVEYAPDLNVQIFQQQGVKPGVSQLSQLLQDQLSQLTFAALFRQMQTYLICDYLDEQINRGGRFDLEFDRGLWQNLRRYQQTNQLKVYIKMGQINRDFLAMPVNIDFNRYVSQIRRATNLNRTQRYAYAFISQYKAVRDQVIRIVTLSIHTSIQHWKQQYAWRADDFDQNDPEYEFNHWGFKITGKSFPFAFAVRNSDATPGVAREIQNISSNVFIDALIPLYVDQASSRAEWVFYGRKGRAHDIQLKPYTRQCIIKLEDDIRREGMPALKFDPSEDNVQQIVRYCVHHNVTYKAIGVQKHDLHSKFQIHMFPRHVQLVPRVKEGVRSQTSIAVFHKDQAYRTDVDPNWRERKQDWVVGGQLPLDPQIDAQAQIALRKRCLVIDIEALSINQSRQPAYMICCVGYPYTSQIPIYRCWSNTQTQSVGYNVNMGRTDRIELQSKPTGRTISYQCCIQRFVQWLAEIAHQYTKAQPLVIWGYNSMGYQMVYIIKALTRVFVNVQLLGEPSECKSFSVAQGRVVFADILKLLPGGKLSKACKDFNTVIKKQDLDISLYSNWQMVKEHYQRIKEYCYYDCVSSLLLLHKIQCIFISFARELKMPFSVEGIADKRTASGMGWYFFVQGFLQLSIIDRPAPTKSNPVSMYNTEPQEVYNYQRKSFTGGMVQIFKYIHQGPVYVVDVNSMYPFILLRDLPWKFIGEIPQAQLQSSLGQASSDMYLYEVFYYSLPVMFKGVFVSTKQLGDTKNTYYNSYHSSTQPIYLRGASIKRIKHHKGHYMFSRGWRYQSGGITAGKRFAETFYKYRLQAKLDSIKIAAKLMMNSVIGRCSMGPKAACRSTMTPKNQEVTFQDQNTFFQVDEPTQPAVGKLVRITAYITQCARIYLDELAEKAGYDNVLYCDTDSLMLTGHGYDRLGRPGSKSSILGEFKCQRPAQGKYDFYEAGYFKNRKDYILKFTDVNGQTQYLHKSKGVPRRFITRQYTQTMIKSFKSLLPILVNAPVEFKVKVGVDVEMQVWKKDFSQTGVVIKDMLKSSSVIVDRWFPDPWKTGIPRPGSGIIVQDQQEDIDHF